jgi:hypothetical protein
MLSSPTVIQTTRRAGKYNEKNNLEILIIIHIQKRAKNIKLH